jgi:hypothetical protein
MKNLQIETKQSYIIRAGLGARFIQPAGSTAAFDLKIDGAMAAIIEDCPVVTNGSTRYIPDSFHYNMKMYILSVMYGEFSVDVDPDVVAMDLKYRDIEFDLDLTEKMDVESLEIRLDGKYVDFLSADKRAIKAEVCSELVVKLQNKFNSYQYLTTVKLNKNEKFSRFLYSDELGIYGVRVCEDVSSEHYR